MKQKTCAGRLHLRVRYHLLLAVPLYVLSVRYLSDAEGVLLSPFLFLYLFIVMMGSVFPDVDWVFVTLFRGFGHRNPITHSITIPALLLAFLINLNVTWGLIIVSYNTFTFGVATHLLGDFVKTGNIVWISKRYENLWYSINGVLTFLLLYYTGFFTSLIWLAVVKLGVKNSSFLEHLVDQIEKLKKPACFLDSLMGFEHQVSVYNFLFY